MAQSQPQASSVLRGYTFFALVHQARTWVAAADSRGKALAHGMTPKDMFLAVFILGHYHTPSITVLIVCLIWHGCHITMLILCADGGYPGIRIDPRERRERLLRRRRARRARHPGHRAPPFR